MFRSNRILTGREGSGRSRSGAGSDQPRHLPAARDLARRRHRRPGGRPNMAAGLPRPTRRPTLLHTRRLN